MTAEEPEQLRLKLTSLGGTPSGRAEAVKILQTIWDQRWNSGRKGPWADRPAPPQMIEAIESGWFPTTGRAVDLGCGTAEIAAWLAQHGYRTTATDIAQAALDEAARRHVAIPGIEYVAANLCIGPLPGEPFDILVDRGCLHQLPDYLYPTYIRNIAAMAVPGAKMLLFMKAFRHGRVFAGEQEMTIRRRTIRFLFAESFELERSEAVHLDPLNAEQPLPGMAFWLTRRGSGEIGVGPERD